MTRKTRLRLISCIMLVIAVLFVLCAVSNPQLGSVFYIGKFRVGADVWRVCYAIYGFVMTALFAASFFVRDSRRSGKE